MYVFKYMESIYWKEIKFTIFPMNNLVNNARYAKSKKH